MISKHFNLKDILTATPLLVPTKHVPVDPDFRWANDGYRLYILTNNTLYKLTREASCRLVKRLASLKSLRPNIIEEVFLVTHTINQEEK